MSGSLHPFFDIISLLNLWDITTEEEYTKQYKDFIKKHHPDIYKGDKVFAEAQTKLVNSQKDIADNFIDIYGFDAFLIQIGELKNAKVQEEIMRKQYSSYQGNSNPSPPPEKRKRGRPKKDRIEEEKAKAARDDEWYHYEMGNGIEDPSISLDSDISEKRYNKMKFKIRQGADYAFSCRKRVVYARKRFLVQLFENFKLDNRIVVKIYIFDHIRTFTDSSSGWESGSEGIGSHYIRQLNSRLDVLGIACGETVPVAVTSKNRTYEFVTENDRRLFLLSKGNSVYKFLECAGAIHTESATFTRDSKRSYVSVLFNADESVLEGIVSEATDTAKALTCFYGAYEKIRDLHCFRFIPRAHFKSPFENLEYIFCGHDVIIPTKKRAGLFYCGLTTSSRLFTVSDLSSEYFDSEEEAQAICKEMLEISEAVGLIAEKLSVEDADRFSALYGITSYHIGRRVASILSFYQRSGCYIGLHIRFYKISSRNDFIHFLHAAPGGADDSAGLHVSHTENTGDITSAIGASTSLAEMKNIGPVTASTLESIGITSKLELLSHTTEEIIEALISANFSVDFYAYCTLAYSIEGAKADIKTSAISKSRKNEIRSFIASKIDVQG